MNFHVISDGSCDLPQGLVRAHNITVVPFYVSFDSKTYRREIAEIGIREFYDEMVQNPRVYPKSSMPTAADFAAAFEPYAAEGTPILCICITTKFSGSMQSALVAKDMTLEKYPSAKIAVIDATVNTVLQGVYVLEAARLQESGAEFEAAVSRMEAIRESGRIFFTVGSIDYLEHGGRIGRLAGKVAGVLGVKPLITLREGEIFPSGIARGRAGSAAKVLTLLQNYLAERGQPVQNYSFAVGYGYDVAEGGEYAKKVRELLRQISGNPDIPEIPTFQIGATIAVHTGPYPLGVVVLEKSILPEG